MPDVSCLYCGARIADNVDTCPHCHSPSHYQVVGKSRTRQKTFIRNFILLVIFIIIMIVWLPR